MVKLNAPVNLIHNEAEYNSALDRYEQFFDSEPAAGSREADEFVLLGMVIARYEDEHYPIENAEPVGVIEAVMQARGYSKKDLGTVLGSAPRASEILSRKRELTLAQIRKLHRAWGIPSDALIGEDGSPRVSRDHRELHLRP